MIKKWKTIKRKNCGTKCLGENYRSLDFVENNNFIIVSTEAAVADLLKTRRKTPVSESYFSEPTEFKPVTSLEKDSTTVIFL